MISKTIQNYKMRQPDGDQAGIALLLAVMMIAGITIITVTVSFFVVQEIRTARSSALTEPAIIAAETAGEQGIFRVKRGTFSQTCAAAPYTQLDGSTTSGSVNTRIKKCVTALPATFQVTNANPMTFYLYDPANPNSNLCMEDDEFCPPSGGGAGNQLYSSIVLRHLTGTDNVDVNIETLDGLAYQSGVLEADSTEVFNIASDILGSTDERLKVTLTPTAGTVTLEISTTGLYGGLPDYLTIDAEGCVGLSSISGCEGTQEIYKRRINITLPR